MMIKESLRMSTNVVMRAAAPVVSQRTFTGNTKVLDEKEKGDERIFFKRQEEERLRKLREKIGSQGQDASATERQRHQETLSAIFKQFDLDIQANKEFFDTLVDWKRTL